jgi:hypothetical protein
MVARSTSRVLALCMAAFALGGSSPASAKFAGGDGAPANPYQIASAEQLVAVGADPNLWDKHFVLIRDLDMVKIDPNAIVPIGNERTPFVGIFDGRGHSVSNLRMITREPEYTFGLFGCIGKIETPSLPRERLPGHVWNLHLKNVNIQSEGNMTGGLAGTLGQGTITHCSVSGYVQGPGRMGGVGGLVGETQGRIAFCAADATVRGEQNVGGLVGALLDHDATDCCSSGDVHGHEQVGGLIGVAQFRHLPVGIHDKEPADLADPGNIRRCRSDASVTGGYFVGGLVGATTCEGRIEDCCARGPVQGTGDVGGLVGNNFGSCIIRCYANGKVMGQKNTGALIGWQEPVHDANEPDRYPPCRLIVEEIPGPKWRVIFRPAGLGAGTDAQGGMTRLTTTEMRTPAPFQNLGWDFESIWTISPDKPYPRLRWEQVHQRQ